MEHVSDKYTDSNVVQGFFRYIKDVAEEYNENPLLHLRDISNQFYSSASNKLFSASTEEDMDHLWNTKIPLFSSLGSLDDDVLQYLEEAIQKDEITKEDINIFCNIASTKSREPASIGDIQKVSKQFLVLMYSHVKGDVSVSTISSIVDGYYNYIDKRASLEWHGKQKIITDLEKIVINPLGVKYGKYKSLRQTLEEMLKLSLQDQLPVTEKLDEADGDVEELSAKKEEPAESSSQNLSFKDVIGLSSAKEVVLRNLVLPAINPMLGKELGEDTANLLILYGPPGTGKTMFARALSGELDAIYKEIGTIQKKYVGEAEKLMDNIFSDAKERMKKEGKNVILYFDEITQSFEQERRHDRKLIDKLKSTLSEPNKLVYVTPEGQKLQIYVIGSTNHLDLLDPALYRSERGLALEIPLPSKDERELLWQQKLDGKNTVPGIDYQSLAEQTDRLSGADIVAIINEQNYVAGLRLKPVLNGRPLHECVKELKSITPDDPRITITQETIKEGIRLYRKDHDSSSEPDPGLFQ